MESFLRAWCQPRGRRSAGPRRAPGVRVWPARLGFSRRPWRQRGAASSSRRRGFTRGFPGRRPRPSPRSPRGRVVATLSALSGRAELSPGGRAERSWRGRAERAWRSRRGSPRWGALPRGPRWACLPGVAPMAGTRLAGAFPCLRPRRAPGWRAAPSPRLAGRAATSASASLHHPLPPTADVAAGSRAIRPSH
jgi:hypothetical protein